jgi:hypothetical protein
MLSAFAEAPADAVRLRRLATVMQSAYLIKF